jgi:hypothetical protein
MIVSAAINRKTDIAADTRHYRFQPTRIKGKINTVLWLAYN